MRIAQGYAANAKLLSSLPVEVTDGIYAISPSPSVDSAAYKRLAKALGVEDVDPYSAQCHDHASLVCLAIAKAREATGTAIKDNIRKISQGAGPRSTTRWTGSSCSGRARTSTTRARAVPATSRRPATSSTPSSAMSRRRGQAQALADRLSPSLVHETLQLLLNGLVAGTVLAVPAIGFTAIYAVLRFPNFTVASHATIGAFAGYVANTAWGLPAAPCVALRLPRGGGGGRAQRRGRAQAPASVGRPHHGHRRHRPQHRPRECPALRLRQ